MLRVERVSIGGERRAPGRVWEEAPEASVRAAERVRTLGGPGGHAGLDASGGQRLPAGEEVLGVGAGLCVGLAGEGGQRNEV